MGVVADETERGLAPTFDEKKPLLAQDEALAEANRCLFCYDAPCTRVCPTHIDVPAFIKKIATGNMLGSARVILEANVLGASCARVCPTEELCEGACVLHDLHQRPIDIGRLQRYATDPVVMVGRQLFERGAPTGKRVALVGAGLAGLACAHELTRRGHEALCFEAAAKPGGLNSFGVAEYKMDHATAMKEVEWVQALGFEVRCNTRVGVDVAVQSLLDDFDAVFIGIGLGPITPLGLAGEELERSMDALDFIAALKTRPKSEVSLVGKSVAVVGGGNTAIDAVTQSCRLGASRVYLVYRRGVAEMPAYTHEIELARHDGVEFVLMAQPRAVVDDEQGGAGGLVGLRTELGEPDADGRRRPREVKDSEFTLEVDYVLRASGQAKQREFFGAFSGVEIDAGGRVVVDDEGRTGNPMVWASGDCANGGKEVVNAVAEGKRAAISIDRALRTD